MNNASCSYWSFPFFKICGDWSLWNLGCISKQLDLESILLIVMDCFWFRSVVLWVNCYLILRACLIYDHFFYGSVCVCVRAHGKEHFYGVSSAFLVYYNICVTKGRIDQTPVDGKGKQTVLLYLKNSHKLWLNISTSKSCSDLFS